MKVGEICLPYIPFTDEQKRRANSVDLEVFLFRRGEKLLPSGHEKRMSSDHSVTIRGNAWFDHKIQLGGHAISFVQRYCGLSYPATVQMLLEGEDGSGYPPAGQGLPVEPKPFVLPPRHTEMRRLFAYLAGHRGISREILHFFTHAGVLYKDMPYHNAVFVGMDEHGVPRHAHKRGTDAVRKPFRINVSGSQPQYSFHHVGVDDSLFVFESPIDLLSFLCLHPENWKRHSYVALCGTGGHAMRWMMGQYPQLKRVYLCLDNDQAGQTANQRLAKEARKQGYLVEALVPQRKDWNDDLTATM